VVCGDEGRFRRLLAACTASSASAWAGAHANCALLADAAAHDMRAAVEELLALPPAVEGGQSPFSPDM